MHSTKGLALGAIVVAALFVEACSREERPAVKPIVPDAPAPAVVAPSPAPAEGVARPVTPVYAPHASEPAAIYRCGAGSKTTYSQTPCDGGRVVESSSAVTGFDSRPSATLDRMVKDGRRYAPPPPEPGVRVASAAPMPLSNDCATMAQQVRDID